MGDEHTKDIGWNHKLEEYFASTGEKAHCLSWLHKQCEGLFSWMTAFIDLPVIILSAIIGAINIGSKSLFGDSYSASIILGSASIFIATLSSVGTYFSWNKRAEQHRISYIYYSKMYRYLSVEMSLPRHERVRPKDLLKYVRNEYDRLSEISPLFPSSIIKKFNVKFKNETEISQPEEVNGLEKITIYVGPTQHFINTSIGPTHDDDASIYGYSESDSENEDLNVKSEDDKIDITPSTMKNDISKEDNIAKEDVSIDIPPSITKKDVKIDISQDIKKKAPLIKKITRK